MNDFSWHAAMAGRESLFECSPVAGYILIIAGLFIRSLLGACCHVVEIIRFASASVHAGGTARRDRHYWRAGGAAVAGGAGGAGSGAADVVWQCHPAVGAGLP